MNAIQLMEKVRASETRIEKKRASIEKAQVRAEKLAGKLVDFYGSIPEDVGFYDEMYSTWDSYLRAMDTQKNALKAIEKMEKTLNDYRERLENAQAMERTLPQCMKDLRAHLEDVWNEWDIKEQKKLREEYNAVGYKAFLEKYSRSKYSWTWDMTEDSIKKSNNRAANELVCDLYARVIDRTGAPRGWDGIRLGQSAAGPVLNGIVEGEKGTVRVESILAGGYNIQRLHVRVLVKNI